MLRCGPVGKGCIETPPRRRALHSLSPAEVVARQCLPLSLLFPTHATLAQTMTPSAPPPRKRVAPTDHPRGGQGARRTTLTSSPLVLDLPVVSGPAAASEEEAGDAGEWLFKEGDVVLGPVPASVLVERLSRGELHEETPIGRQAGQWRPLGSVTYFADLLRKAEELRRKEAERRRLAAEQRKTMFGMAAGWVAVAVVPLFAGGLLGNSLMERRPWDDTPTWIAKVPPLVDLPTPPRAAPVEVSATRAATRGKPEADPEAATGDATEAKQPDATRVASDAVTRAKSRGKKGRASAKSRSSRTGNQKKLAQATNGAGGKSSEKPAAPSEQLLSSLSTSQVTAGLTQGKAGIGRCLKTEVGRNPDMPGVVTLMFTITEEGRGINVKLKEREVRDGPLAACLAKVVGGLRWPKFSGERKNAEFPFRIKK